MSIVSLGNLKKPFEAYRGHAPYVFVSYSHRDREVVYIELVRLRKLGFNVWYDEGLSPGSRWSDELAERIANSALFLYFVTPGSVASANCQDEANFVLEAGNSFLAVHLEETELPPGLQLRMGSRQAILRYQLEPDLYQRKLYEAIVSHAPDLEAANIDLRNGFQLGDFTVTPLTGSITGLSGEARHLEPKVMDVLVVLAEQSNELVTRDQLLGAVWRGQPAADQLLTRAIGEIRRVLKGDQVSSKYVHTVPKRGYRLIADIQPVDGSGLGFSDGDAGPAAFRIMRKWIYTAACVVALAFAILVFDQYLPGETVRPGASWNESTVTGETTAPPLVPENSIAVLPFEDLSADPEQGYLVDGIHGEVIASLARVSALKVISRSSVMQYRGQNKPPSVVANQLNVGRIVGGTVKRDGNRIMVTVELIDARSGEHLWGNDYKEELVDVFALQSDVARAIVEELRVELTPLEQTILSASNRIAPNPDAYLAYLKGSEILNEALGSRTLKGVNYFKQSIRADPGFAPAHAALAHELIYDLVFIKDGPERQEWISRASTAAQKAMQLDSSLVEAHVAQARVEGYLRNWDTARNAYERAFGLSGNLSVAHSAYGDFLARLGHLDAALVQMKEAQRLAPLSPGVNQQLGKVYFWRAEYDKAIEQMKLVLEIDPAHGIARNNLGWVYATAGMVEPLLADNADDTNCSDLEKLAFAYAVRGQNPLAEETYKESLELCPLGEGAGALEASTLYFILQDEEKALELLRRSYDRLDEEFVLETRFPWWDPLRGHPDFVELMKKSGLDKAAKPFSECQSCRWLQTPFLL